MKVRLAIGIVIVLLLSGLVTNCTTPTAAPTATTAPPATATPEVVGTEEVQATATPEPTPTFPPAPAAIEIGASIPLTGRFGALGTQVQAGYQFAVEDINAAGGVFVAEYGVKVPLHLTVIDDASDPNKAATNMETLYSENHVTAYLGGAASDMHVATVPIAEKNKVPYLGVSFANLKLHQQGYKYLFSPFCKVDHQAVDTFQALADWLTPENRPLKLAIFQEQSDVGIENATLWMEQARVFGYSLVDHEIFTPRTADMSQMILAAKAKGAEMLLATAGTPDGMTMVRQMAELGWTPKFTLIVRAPDPVSWGATLGKIGDYIAMFPAWHNAMPFPGVTELNAKHQAAFGRPADVLVGPAYACVQILAAAIENAGTLDRDAITDAILETDMTTVMGPVTFNEDGTGNVLDPMVMWVNGKQELVWPKEYKTVDLPYPAVPFEQR